MYLLRLILTLIQKSVGGTHIYRIKEEEGMWKQKGWGHIVLDWSHCEQGTPGCPVGAEQSGTYHPRLM